MNILQPPYVFSAAPGYFVHDNRMAMLTTRETAIVVWLTMATLWLISKPQLRVSLGPVFRSLLHPKLLTPLLLMIAYVFLVVSGLSSLGLWTPSLLKDTLVWLTFIATATAVQALQGRGTEWSWRSTLLQNFRIIIVLEFIIAAYTFALPVELLLVPLLTLLALIGAVSERDERHASVARLAAALQATAGFAILGAALHKATVDVSRLGSFDSVRALMLPALLSVAFLPFAYGLALFSGFENLFVTLVVGRDRSASVARYARRRIILHVGFSLRRLETLAQHRLALLQVRTNADVDSIIEAYRLGRPQSSDSVRTA